MTSKRYFTWSEAMALIPRLNEIFGAVSRLRSHMRTLYEQLEALGTPPTQKNIEEPGTPEIMRLRALFRGMFETLQDQLRGIEELGAHVKDIDSGLVDFYFEKEGRDVFLCWRYGETEIAFFHEIDSGFSSRRALSKEDRERGRLLH